MEIKTIVTVIIAGMLGAVVFVGLLPVFAETSSANDTFTNEGIYYATPLKEDSEYTITWEYTSPTVLTINDEVYDLSELTSEYLGITFAFSNDWMLRYQKDSAGILLIKVNEASTTVDTASVSAEKSLNVAISNGDADITIGTTTYNYTIASDGLIITLDDKAEYVVKRSTDKAYVLDDSMIYGAGRTGRPFGTGTALSTLGKGNVSDGMTIEISPSTYSVDSSSISSTKVSSYKDLYELTGFSFVLNNGEDTTTTITYNQIFVPHEVSAEKSIHPDGPTTALLNLLPVLIAIGLIIGVAGAIFIKRM